MNSVWDVVVVGAGPGGSSAAYHLARSGLRVLLLEKEKMPRYKPCGGGLTAKIRTALDFDFSAAIETTVRQVSVGYGAERLRINATETWLVMRPKFDALLAQHAAGAGAEIREGEPVSGVEYADDGVRIATRHGTERARLVVGADGVNGIVRRSAGFAAHKRMAVALEAEMDASSAALEEWRGALHIDFGAIPWGYAWIFPKAEHLSVGIGDLVRPGHVADLRAELERYVAREPSLRGATSRLTRGHRVPLGGATGIYHTGRALLVGDAAGLVDPFTAEGIYYAIRSGQIAAEEARRALEDGASRGGFDLAAYSRRINSEINSDFRFAWILTQAFYRMPHLAYRLFAKSAAIQSAVTDVADGAATYRRMVWNVVTGLVR